MKQWTGALRRWLVHDGPSPRAMRAAVITSVVVLTAASAVFVVIGIHDKNTPEKQLATAAQPKARPHTPHRTTKPANTGPHGAHAVQPAKTVRPAVVKVILPPPTGASATPAGAALTIAWTAAPSSSTLPVDGYNVYLGTSSKGQPTFPANGKTLITGTSFVDHGVTVGVTYYATVKAVSGAHLFVASNEASAVAGSNYHPTGVLPTPVVGMAAPPDGSGYWLVNYQGTVSAHGAAQDYGSVSASQLVAPIVGIASTPSGHGYWEVARDGGVFSFGDATFHGSLSGKPLAAAIVGIAPTADGQGYWEVGADGGVFAFGDAQYFGSTDAKALNTAMVGIVGDPSGSGYWEVARSGAVFSYNAPFFGSASQTADGHPVGGMVATSTGKGYWVFGRNGSVFSYGDAEFHGSLTGKRLNSPIAMMAADAAGGYWLMGYDGGIFTFGASFFGSG